MQRNDPQQGSARHDVVEPPSIMSTVGARPLQIPQGMNRQIGTNNDRQKHNDALEWKFGPADGQKDPQEGVADCIISAPTHRATVYLSSARITFKQQATPDQACEV